MELALFGPLVLLGRRWCFLCAPARAAGRTPLRPPPPPPEGSLGGWFPCCLSNFRILLCTPAFVGGGVSDVEIVFPQNCHRDSDAEGVKPSSGKHLV